LSSDFTLYRESAAFVRRLERAVQAYDESAYHSARRINWSYRYATGFGETEGELYTRDPDRYLAILEEPTPGVEDVFSLPVDRRGLIRILLKIAAHWLFAALGLVAARTRKRADLHIYRKCYADDIENVFDPLEAGVLRHVFPFPLNLRRQWRYLALLKQTHKPFVLAGYPYAPADVIDFLRNRTVASLRKLEARAQIRLGRAIKRQRKWTCIQLSDEFDICSLDFVRTLRRPDLRVINSAHGVGKYFPVHAYDEFRVLTRLQQEYYRATRPCHYVMNKFLPSRPAAPAGETISTGMKLVFVSQTFGPAGKYLAQCEDEVLDLLATSLGGRTDLELLIKPHPNRSTFLERKPFSILRSLDNLGSPGKTIFVSFFSTSYLDPAFRGRHLLLRYGVIRPEICFDDASVVSIDQLVQTVRDALRDYD